MRRPPIVSVINIKTPKEGASVSKHVKRVTVSGREVANDCPSADRIEYRRATRPDTVIKSAVARLVNNDTRFKIKVNSDASSLGVCWIEAADVRASKNSNPNN
jgi:hypothetical protein